jgi:hypothetical protein
MQTVGNSSTCTTHSTPKVLSVIYSLLKDNHLFHSIGLTEEEVRVMKGEIASVWGFSFELNAISSFPSHRWLSSGVIVQSSSLLYDISSNDINSKQNRDAKDGKGKQKSKFKNEAPLEVASQFFVHRRPDLVDMLRDPVGFVLFDIDILLHNTSKFC